MNTLAENSNVRPPLRIVELEDLFNSISTNGRDLGVFREVDSSAMPEKFRKLLAHNEHMTIAVEAFHGSTVSVEVLDSRRNDSLYIREILLHRTSDHKVVQYGIVRLQLNALDEAPRNEILSEKIPLGRVLIEHNVLREVELVDLWEITISSKLASLLGVELGTITYGRTAMIYFSEHPALELLEVVI